MQSKISIALVAFSGLAACAFLVAWTLAVPPSGAAGTTSGAIIATTTAGKWVVTINGTTTIQKSLDVSGNKILNVAAPTSDTDAANKAYVDAALASVTSSTTRVWGQGRPGITVFDTAGECTRTIAGRTAKVSRSSRTASWDGSTAACPIGWWVCTAAERGAACGEGLLRNGIKCDIPAENHDELKPVTNTWGWIANTSATANREYGAVMISTNGIVYEDFSCSLYPVWCCGY